MAGEIYRKKKRLGDMLVSEHVVTPEQIDQALEARKTNGGKKLGETLVELGFTSEENITKALTRQLGVEMVAPSTIQIADDVVNLVNPNILRKYMVMPFGFAANNPNVLRVAMSDPMDMVAIDDLAMVTHLEIEPYIATCVSTSTSVMPRHWTPPKPTRKNVKRRQWPVRKKIRTTP